MASGTDVTGEAACTEGEALNEQLAMHFDHQRFAPVVAEQFGPAFESYRTGCSSTPLLLRGKAEDVLAKLPSESVDFVMTSPPYWGMREYDNGGIGLERECREYVKNLCAVFKEIRRVLKCTGSVWLNIGDSYNNKGLVGIPWRIAF